MVVAVREHGDERGVLVRVIKEERRGRGRVAIGEVDVWLYGVSARVSERVGFTHLESLDVEVGPGP